jgi:hypothetical protein
MTKKVRGQKQFFSSIFCTFGRYRYVTNLRGTFVENVKKSKINPPYCTALRHDVDPGPNGPAFFGMYMVR